MMATNAGADRQAVHKVEILISNLLRVGVISSLVVVVAGTAMSFVHHPNYLSSAHELQRLTTPGAAFPHTLKETFQGLRQGNGRSVVVLGLLLLVATPVMRVAVTVIAFLIQRDHIFAAITTIVLILLLLSFLLGKGG